VDEYRRNPQLHKEGEHDKERPFQSWAWNVLSKSHFQENTRNKHPDFFRESIGFEAKSLKFKKRFRKTLDFNSTLPVGKKNGITYFLLFGLYDKNDRLMTLNLSHMSLINRDDFHEPNTSIKEVGTYGDGTMRLRKMYVFPHPVTMLESCLGKTTLILPSAAKCDLKQIGKIVRHKLVFKVYEPK
jgi:hypothetical protein